ncbi:MAG: RimK domain-containing protein ATP-grasp [Pseudonocardiales bacterium]|nr:RimK domain-containing protein ATP-grasp [Pseudonocardiales bacterium]
MILLCGIPTETPLALVGERLAALRTVDEVVVLNQRHVRTNHIEYQITTEGISGDLTVNGRSYDLRCIRAVYLRLIDHRQFPELVDEPEQSPLRHQVGIFHQALIDWSEATDALVVNRFSRQASNGSKPYQAQIIQRLGFRVPETLITNDPDLVREFAREHGRVIYKSTSGIRSIVSELDDAAQARLELIRWCPVQFQRHVEGMDVRVHVVGAEVFATAIDSAATDYRYAARQNGTPAELSSYDLKPDVAERCVQLAATLELPFAGVDLRLSPDGAVYCFEVNPSPAYSYYENHTGQPIAAAVAALLANASAAPPSTASATVGMAAVDLL